MKNTILVLTALTLPTGYTSAQTAASAEGVPLLVLPGEARSYRGQQGRQNDITELLATAEQTGGKLGIFRQTIAPGSGPPVHLHMREVEFAYVIEGDFAFKLGDRLERVPVGTFMFMPQMTAHSYKNVGTQPGVLLFGVSAGGMEKMFAEREGVDAETNKRLMEKYHMVVVAPPLP